MVTSAIVEPLAQENCSTSCTPGINVVRPDRRRKISVMATRLDCSEASSSAIPCAPLQYAQCATDHHADLVPAQWRQLFASQQHPHGKRDVRYGADQRPIEVDQHGARHRGSGCGSSAVELRRRHQTFQLCLAHAAAALRAA